MLPVVADCVQKNNKVAMAILQRPTPKFPNRVIFFLPIFAYKNTGITLASIWTVLKVTGVYVPSVGLKAETMNPAWVANPQIPVICPITGS